MAKERDPYTKPKEEERMGGSKERIGPGGGMPNARDMDRPESDCNTYDRHGDGTMSIPRGIRTIQGANGNGGSR